MDAIANEQQELIKTTEAMLYRRAKLLKCEDELIDIETALETPLGRLSELMGISSAAVLEDIEGDMGMSGGRYNVQEGA